MKRAIQIESNDDDADDENADDDDDDDDNDDNNDDNNDENSQWRILDRKIRWYVFLYVSNLFAFDFINKIYDNLNSNSTTYVTARSKIYDNVKTYKRQMLIKMKINYFIYQWCWILFTIC